MHVLKATSVRVLRSILPNSVKRSLLHLSFHLATPEFERFAHVHCAAPNMGVGLETLAARGFRPGTIVDVGAYDGGWTETANRIWPQSRPVLIEPNLSKHKRLAALSEVLGGEFHGVLLGSACGETVSFHVMASGSSILSENSSAERTVETRTVTTLDSLDLALHGEKNFLKIDVQGYELEVMKGARHSLKAFEAVLLEVATIEINDGAPLLHDVITFMAERDFIPIEIFEIHRRPLDRATAQIDVLFVRRNSSLIADRRYN